jgi:hypothetical protein
MATFDPKAVEALAEAWASIDGNVAPFLKGKRATSPEEEYEEHGGHYSGYIAEAEEMLTRLLKRGFILTPHGAPVNADDQKGNRELP